MLLVALTAVTAPAAAGIPKDFFGIIPGGPLDSADLAGMHKAKIRTARFFLSWPNVEPKPGVWHWPDLLVGGLAAHGIRAEPQLTGTPQWATGSKDNRKPPLHGKALHGWKRFVKKAVQRYKPGGRFWHSSPGAHAVPVKDWQVWNEPNLKKEWPPNASGKSYAKLVKITDKVIHRADRHAKVVLAGLSGGDHPKSRGVNFPQFLKKLYKVRKIRKHFDAVALHPYGPTVKATKKRIQQTRKVMKHHSDKHTKLWITEIGYGSAHKDRFGLNKGSEKAQAHMLKKTYKLITKNRKRWRIGKLDWYDWRDPANPDQRHYCSFCPYAGLLRANGSPKPAYHQFRHFSRRAH